VGFLYAIKEPSLERPHLPRAAGRGLAPDKIDLSEPGGRKLKILRIIDIPFEPVFFLREQLFLAGEQIYDFLLFLILSARYGII